MSEVKGLNWKVEREKVGGEIAISRLLMERVTLPSFACTASERERGRVRDQDDVSLRLGLGQDQSRLDGTHVFLLSDVTLRDSLTTIPSHPALRAIIQIYGVTY